jgi:putative transposase
VRAEALDKAHQFAGWPALSPDFGEGWGKEQSSCSLHWRWIDFFTMPSRLKRYQHSQQLHFITFTCYHRKKYLQSAAARDIFEKTLERVRRWYGFQVFGYVVMPEHVHLLLSEPERGTLAIALQMLKQTSSRKLQTHTNGEPCWQKRYYDFNVSTSSKIIEKLRYMHRNPVKRELVANPEDWMWSSYQHHLSGIEGVVEIESDWTANRRDAIGRSR